MCWSGKLNWKTLGHKFQHNVLGRCISLNFQEKLKCKVLAVFVPNTLGKENLYVVRHIPLSNVDKQIHNRSCYIWTNRAHLILVGLASYHTRF